MVSLVPAPDRILRESYVDGVCVCGGAATVGVAQLHTCFPYRFSWKLLMVLIVSFIVLTTSGIMVVHGNPDPQLRHASGGSE